MSVPQPPQGISSPHHYLRSGTISPGKGKQSLQMGLLQGCPLHEYLTAAASSHSIRVALPCVLLEGTMILPC